VRPDLITPLLLSCVLTVYMNPPILVSRSKKPLLETGFTLIGLANCADVVRSAQGFFDLRTLAFLDYFEILVQNLYNDGNDRELNLVHVCCMFDQKRLIEYISYRAQGYCLSSCSLLSPVRRLRLA
jgi:hypothetical protein